MTLTNLEEQRVRLQSLLRRFCEPGDHALSDVQFIAALHERFVRYRTTHEIIDPNE